MKDHGKNVNFLDEKDTRFYQFRKVLDAQMKQLHAAGIGSVTKQADPITPTKEAVLWQKKLLGDSSSESLLNTFFFNNCKLFGLRGRDKHRALQHDQIILSEDNNGSYILIFSSMDVAVKIFMAEYIRES